MKIPQKDQKLSIIIPNLNSPIVDRTVDSILKQGNDFNFEVIVVGLDEQQLLNKFQDIIFHIDPGVPIPPGTARNLGVANSTGSLLIFIDSDAIAEQNFIKEHLEAHLRNQDSIIGGSVNFPISPYFQLCDNIATFHEYMVHMPAGKKRIIPTVNMSISREKFLALGGFNDDLAGEDSDFSIRAHHKNFRVLFEPSIEVQHLPQRKSLNDLLNHSYKLGQYTKIFSELSKRNIFYKVVSRSKFLQFLLSPIITVLIMGKIIIIEQLPINYWHTLPIIFLLKFTWCIGASLGSSTK